MWTETRYYKLFISAMGHQVSSELLYGDPSVIWKVCEVFKEWFHRPSWITMFTSVSFPLIISITALWSFSKHSLRRVTPVLILSPALLLPTASGYQKFEENTHPYTMSPCHIIFIIVWIINASWINQNGYKSDSKYINQDVLPAIPEVSWWMFR